MARILVVDDDASLRHLLDEVLRVEGFEVDTLAGAAGVVDHVRTHPVDAIVLDLGLPDGDGLDILRTIRSDAELHDVSVVVLTGRDEERDREASLSAGADYYLTKPFEPDFLVATLGVMVAQAGQADVTRQAEAWGEFSDDLEP